MAAKRKAGSARDTLVFVDTNIFLNFYRFNRPELTSFLNRLAENKDIIITGRQVEMEFLRRRQTLLEQAIKSIESQKLGIQPSPLLKGTDPGRKFQRALEEYRKQQKLLVKALRDSLANPGSHDPVYEALQKLFSHESGLNLSQSEESELWQGIFKRAERRFLCGYPPRKDGDTSIGDAINWEWVLHCARENRGAEVVVVSQDADYGVAAKEGSYHLNDWLAKEFAERVGPRRKIVLTGRLANALKRAGISVTEKEVAEEKEAFIRGLRESLMMATKTVPMAAASTELVTNPLVRFLTSRPAEPFLVRSGSTEPVEWRKLDEEDI